MPLGSCFGTMVQACRRLPELHATKAPSMTKGMFAGLPWKSSFIGRWFSSSLPAIDPVEYEQVKVHGSTSKQPGTESAQVRLDRPAVLLVNDAALHDEIDVLQQVDVFEHVTAHGNDIRSLAR